jgi:hypothetical protein
MSSRTKYNPGIVGTQGKSWSETVEKSFGVQTAEWMKLIARINNPQQQTRVQKTMSKLEIILSYIFCISLLLLYLIGILLFFQYL